MKNFKLLSLISVFGLLLFACSKPSEEIKMISANAVKISGTHDNLIKISGDSIKIMLVKSGEKYWAIRAIIPISNTMPWSEVPNTDESAEYYFRPEFSDVNVEFLDANSSPIDYKISIDYDILENIIASENSKTEEVLLKEWWDKEYDKAKEIFDKIAGIKISNINLQKTYNSRRNKLTADDSYESEKDASSSIEDTYTTETEDRYSSAQIDAMLDKLESLIKKHKQQDPNSYSYLSTSTQIMELINKLTFTDMSYAQESRFLKIGELIDDLN